MKKLLLEMLLGKGTVYEPFLPIVEREKKAMQRKEYGTHNWPECSMIPIVDRHPLIG